MNCQRFFGLFVVVLVSTFLAVRYFGAPAETIPIGVAILILGIGISKVVRQLRK
jgi:ABC-type uncharacterized transport system permease subunit